jgi:hypothetical protein
MSGPAHRFASRWHVAGDTAEVFDLLANPAGFPEWWGSVHAAARVLEDGRPDGVGRAVELVSGARLPRLLRVRATMAAVNRPHACALELRGDLEGEAAWHLRRDGPYVIADLDCRVRAVGTLAGWRLAALAAIARAEFRWAMRQGRLGLLLELRRRHAVTAHERAMIPRLAGVAVREARREIVTAEDAAALIPPLPAGPREPAA